jgi:endonuclease/exonuclease/phosphatase family metal-dependent hydrolase
MYVCTSVYAQKYIRRPRSSTSPSYNHDDGDDDTAAAVVDWHGHRRARVLECLAETKGNIICLQEVQVDLWDDLTRPLLSRPSQTTDQEKGGDNDDNNNAEDDNTNNTNTNKSNYYTCLLQNTTHEVGCAVLLQPAASFEVVATESRSRAFIVSAHLKVAGTDTTAAAAAVDTTSASFSDDGTTTTIPLIIASVHLEAGRSHELTRFYQLRSLLKRIDWHHRHHFASSSPAQNRHNDDAGTPPYAAAASAPLIILAGDCNMVNDGPLYEWLSTGRWESKQQLELSRTAPRTYDLLPATLMQHPSIRRTFDRQLILDYIWLLSSSSSLAANETAASSSFLEATPALAFASRAGQIDSTTTVQWPNAHHPSDHWPIAMELIPRQQQQANR